MPHIDILHSRFRTVFALLTVAILGLCSCDSDGLDPEIDFVGDSIVARWDIYQDFPSYYVKNFGIGGSGIELLDSYHSKFTGDDVVVLTGTNDHHNFQADRREQYVENYISAVSGLTDRQIFLFSVLPRDFEGDRADINSDIKAFNQLVEKAVFNIERITYIDVYHDFMDGDHVDMRYFSDGLHPNSIGYEILTQKLLKAL